MSAELNEHVCYLLRKTSMSRTEIGKLSPGQLKAMVDEISYQESVEDYRTQHIVATIVAAIYNTIPRKNNRSLTHKDFLQGGPPVRAGQKVSSGIEVMAEKKGIILPKE